MKESIQWIDFRPNGLLHPAPCANRWDLLVYYNTKGRFVSGPFVSALGRLFSDEKID
ncbi:MULTISPECIES: hypothetical protein [Rhizobium]|uniref:hypothetical protein n=1 Tax=Rhizobium TaxID=379 RepID=UPI0013EE4D35|nr:MULTISPECIES: hypothetical protein [Rhizobium]MBA9036600.1 hypothetical protein [Rhizobium leguminosarum]MCJ9697323.1 hypothetical protein [Rhizobium sp. PRIMUS64]MDI5928422.1 hypothetical protein [Rhizobium leguminosarum]